MAVKSWKQSIILGVLVVVFGLVHSGYVVSLLDDGVTTTRWFVADYPIEIRIWEGFTDQLPQVVDGSNPKAALKEALERWIRTTSVNFVFGAETSISDAGFDRVHLVTLADTAANQA